VKISKQARQQARQLFRACLTDAGIDEGRVRQSVAALVETKPRGYLAILTHFARLLKLELDRRTARIDSASSLPPALQSDLRDKLSRRHGPGLRFEFAVNPALIGGLRIQVGSEVYESNIRARLLELAAKFNSP